MLLSNRVLLCSVIHSTDKASELGPFGGFLIGDFFSNYCSFNGIAYVHSGSLGDLYFCFLLI